MALPGGSAPPARGLLPSVASPSFLLIFAGGLGLLP
jgi:hypothetical protein